MSYATLVLMGEKDLHNKCENGSWLATMWRYLCGGLGKLFNNIQQYLSTCDITGGK